MQLSRCLNSKAPEMATDISTERRLHYLWGRLDRLLSRKVAMECEEAPKAAGGPCRAVDSASPHQSALMGSHPPPVKAWGKKRRPMLPLSVLHLAEAPTFSAALRFAAMIGADAGFRMHSRLDAGRTSFGLGGTLQCDDSAPLAV